MTLGLVGVAAPNGTAAVAQVESTRQTFETREMTGPEATTPENTTRTPTSEQSAGDMQAGTECSGAVVVGTVGPTDEDLVIGPFTITGEKVRLTYETTDVDESGLPFFDVTVLDEAGNQVGGRVIFEEGTEVDIVRAVPGEFTIEARAEDLKYNLTAEDCRAETIQDLQTRRLVVLGEATGNPSRRTPSLKTSTGAMSIPPRKTSSTTRYRQTPSQHGRCAVARSRDLRAHLRLRRVRAPPAGNAPGLLTLGFLRVAAETT